MSARKRQHEGEHVSHREERLETTWSTSHP